MKILVRLFIVSTVFSLVLLAIKLKPGDESLAYQRIQDRFDTQLDLLEDDLVIFLEQFEVLTNPFKIESSKKFKKRVYVNGALKYWSDNDFIPAYGILKENDTLYSVNASSGVYVVRREVIPSNAALVEVFSIIQISSKPPISNEYLSPTINRDVFDSHSVSFNIESAYLKRANNKIIGYSITSEVTSFGDRWFSLAFAISVILLFIVLYFHFFKESLNRTKLLIILAFLILFKIVSYFITDPLKNEWALFNPIYFTAGIINLSLGQLIINSLSLLVFCIMFFRLSKWMRYTGLLITSKKIFQVLSIFVITFSVNLFGYLLYLIPWTILEHSQIELDISQSITFDFLRITSVIVLAINAFSFLILFVVLQKIHQHLKVSNAIKSVIYIFSAGAIYLIYGDPTLPVLVFVSIVWLLVNWTNLSFQFFNLRYETFLYLVILLVLSSGIYSTSIYKHFEKDRIISKEKYANRLLIPNDILGEYYLNEIVTEIEEDPYIRQRLLSRTLARQNIREKITRQFLSTYFKKYDIEVYLFGPNGESYDSPNSMSYFDWRRQYQTQKNRTDYPELFFVEDKSDNIRNRYLSFLSIKGFNRQIGYIILELALKRNIPTSVFPELLVESKYYLSTDQEMFDYAIYHGNSTLPVYKQGRSGFESTLSYADLKDKRLFSEGLERNEVHYFGLKTTDDRIIVIASENYDNMNIYGNFSFLLMVMLLLSGLVFIGLRLARARTHLNLSTKIQLYLGMAFILPMLVVSVALLNTLNASYRKEIDQNFLSRSFNLAGSLVEKTEAFENNLINRDDYSNIIAEASTLSQNDINIYNASGFLLASSQMEIFNSGILGEQIKPEVLNAIVYNNEQSIIVDETIGTLEFRSSYSGLRSYKTGNLLGILSMPYFESKAHLRNQQIQVFINLISVFTLIFLISLFAGNIVVSQLVSPLRQIADRIRRTSLQEVNQPITYDANDEIGSLVSEYNQMLVKLEESKLALAESQKESAWKEIARQVAHEIKNPLTPMRLKIQQMMRDMDRESPKYKACDSLIEQIDALSAIADSFSAFAKMPVPKNEHISLNNLLSKTVELYQSNEAELKMELPEHPLTVFADPKILGGILNNIILNGIQSVVNGKAIIDVKLVKKGHKALVSISDNGVGISDALKEKVFTPYFSTKKTGSGIGLAVAKKGIEHAGGNIWFETTVGLGTTFHISLPVSS